LRRRASTLVGLLVLVFSVVPAVIAGAPAASASGSLQGNGSVEEAWLTGATPGDSITLLQNGSAVANSANPGTADSLGSLIIRSLTPGSGYQWDDTTANVESGTFSVLAPGDNPAQSSSLYTDQPMHEGLNYITMRDGIQLAATVRFPYNSAGQLVTCTTAAPCPTVIEYSGYGTAAPSDPVPYTLGMCPGSQCGASNLLPDSSTDVGAVVARLVGFATVSVQMRGTGCSGGAFDLFGYPSDYDAYDAIEIVAHQDWVANHKVGMVGISYSGLSELPSAGTDPPDLAAIAPLSPTDDLFSTGYPGGIFNDGFAASWIDQRIDDAMPAASYSDGALVPLSSTPVTNVAQPWTYYEIDAEMAAHGSSTCLANQALHGQSESLESLVGAQQVAPGTGAGRDPSLFDRRSMKDWAAQIHVPVFISGALEDDQTGPQWPALLNAFPAATHVFANMVNGGHIDSADSQTMSRWLEFLDIFVANKVPKDPGIIGDEVLTLFASQASGTSNQAALPPYRFTTAKTVAKAETQFIKKTPNVEVLFDSGAGSAGAGDPDASYSAAFTQWPPKGKVRTYYFGASGAMSDKRLKPTATSGSATFTLDPSARPAIDLSPSANPWAADPPELWVKSSTPVEDFQATVTEVRPSANQEEYITSGFLRSSNQTPLSDSTSLFTDPNYYDAATNLSPTSYKLVRIPIDPIAHTFRPGTELRVVVSAPGGDRPLWSFDTVDSGQSATVGFGPVAASALVINQVHVNVTTSLPTCGTLRGEPCRSYQAEGNQ
ncbi:MAG: CocE/NonD family hydrolase, partial [Acidimicrobiales bacterium]